MQVAEEKGLRFASATIRSKPARPRRFCRSPLLPSTPETIRSAPHPSN